MDVGRDRVGSLASSTKTVNLRLARWRTAPYRPIYNPVWPERSDIPGGGTNDVNADPLTRRWSIDKFDGGEGEDLWQPELARFYTSKYVIPKPIGDGLVLGPNRYLTQLTGPAAFTQGKYLGTALGKMWAYSNDDLHAWDPSTNLWDASWTTGAAPNDINSLADGEDGTNVFIGVTSTNSIRKVSAAANSEHYDGDAGVDDFVYNPQLLTWDGVLYALDGSKLYEIDMSTTDTRTLKADVPGYDIPYINTNPDYTRQRITWSDVGPIWYQRLNNGTTYIHEWNVGSSTWSVIGMLPVENATPYSLFWANGFVFLGFRYAGNHSLAGEGFLYYQRGAQRGVAGPIRLTSTASEGIWIAGMLGDDLIFYAGGGIWAYNISTGGITQASVSQTSDSTSATVYAAMFGKDLFVAPINGNLGVERFDFTKYYTDSETDPAFWRSGRYNFGYPGVNKIFLDVTVVTEPLPTNTNLTLKVSSNGGAFAAVTGTFTGDGSTTKYTWTVSSPSGTTTGEDFELQLLFDSDDETKTPTVRSIAARAVSAAKQRKWIIEADAGTYDAGSDGEAPRSSDVLADLSTLAGTAEVLTFTNPWEKEDWDSAATFNVVLEQVQLVEAEGEADPYLAFVLREVGYV